MFDRGYIIHGALAAANREEQRHSCRSGRFALWRFSQRRRAISPAAERLRRTARFAAVFLPLFLILGLVSVVYSVFLGNVIHTGLRGWFMRYSRGENARAGEVFASFRIYLPSMTTALLRDVFVFLWSLLFIIPGIVMSYAYSMADYIIYENPNLSPSRALQMSKAMTQGHKGDLFIFDLSFFGWMLLSG